MLSSIIAMIATFVPRLDDQLIGPRHFLLDVERGLAGRGPVRAAETPADRPVWICSVARDGTNRDVFHVVAAAVFSDLLQGDLLEIAQGQALFHSDSL